MNENKPLGSGIMESFDVGKGLDLLGSEVIHDIVMVVHHHRERLAEDQ